MNLVIDSVGLVMASDYGEVSEFNARSELPNRKHLKLMSRADRLGVAAVGRAIAGFSAWENVAPERRGLFVGTTPEGTDPVSLQPALARSVVDGEVCTATFGELGVPYVPPLWLVRGLSNNILGFSCAYWNIQGVNGNRCEGRVSGAAAVVEGVRALQEGRADVVVAGGADSLLRFSEHIDHQVGEGAAFVLMTKHSLITGWETGLAFQPEAPPLGLRPQGVDVGAASGVLQWVKAMQTEEGVARLDVRDETGLRAWLCPV